MSVSSDWGHMLPCDDIDDTSSRTSRQSPLLVWQDDDADGDSHTTTGSGIVVRKYSRVELCSATSSLSDVPSVTTRTDDLDHNVHRHRAATELSVSLQHAQEYPSPSSVSLQHSGMDDILAIASIPSLPEFHLDQDCHSLDLPYKFPMELANVASTNPSIISSSHASRRRRRKETFRRQHSRSEDRFPSPPSSACYTPKIFSLGSCRSPPKFVLMICAFTLVALSIHERIEGSRQEYLQKYLVASGSRREEIEFPLGPMEETTVMEGLPEVSNFRLPKYYLLKVENSGGPLQKNPKASTTHEASAAETTSATSSLRKPRSGSHLAMARSQHARPIFVPDQPLPGGGFRKPVERFVFDPAQQQAQFRDRHHSSSKRNVLSWAPLLSGVALVGIFGTGWKWKEFYRFRNSLQEERNL